VVASWATRFVALGAACAALAALPAAAAADADPASDTLLVQNVFTPYSPQVSQAMSRALTAYTSQTQRAGFPIKVAIVAAPTDLGGVPDMFGKPQPYATFLASEISFNRKQPVLVVMPAGIGTANIPNASAVAGLRVSTGGPGSDGLGQTALKAIERLSAANGHPVKAPKVSSGGGSSGTSPLLAFGAPVALIVIAALLIGLGRRRLPEDDELEEPREAEAPRS
jgi:hypothetical protein